MARSSRLTSTGKIDNICGIREAVQIGKHSVVGGHLQTFAHAGSIRIGEWTFVGEGTRIWSAAEVVIGDRVLISHNASIVDTTSHPTGARLRFRQTKAILTRGHPKEDPGLKSDPIHIGNDVWISFGATIMRGVTVGEGAIIGACSVVTHDVEPWTVVAGNPAMIIRRLDREPPSE
jgi:acetyltransferase-like isoleucine patch superfamily enzyme